MQFSELCLHTILFTTIQFHQVFGSKDAIKLWALNYGILKLMICPPFMQDCSSLLASKEWHLHKAHGFNFFPGTQRFCLSLSPTNKFKLASVSTNIKFQPTWLQNNFYYLLLSFTYMYAKGLRTLYPPQTSLCGIIMMLCIHVYA